MPFVTVPSTESADYINAQKNEWQDTYYVENLNTLGSGGGGGTDVVFAATSQLFVVTTSINTINDWTTLVSNGATCDGTTITLAESGVYEVSFNGSLLNDSAGPLFASIGVKNSGPGFTTYGVSSIIEIQATNVQFYNGNFARSFVANDTLVVSTGASPNFYWNGSADKKHSVVVRKIG